MLHLSFLLLCWGVTNKVGYRVTATYHLDNVTYMHNESQQALTVIFVLL